MEVEKFLTKKRKIKNKWLRLGPKNFGNFNNLNSISHIQKDKVNSALDISKLNHKTLLYEIDSWSSYISTFHPRNILSDNIIAGAVSKWSVDFKSANEYLYIKLAKTSIVSMITFGKFKDPTNLKEFKIFAGLDKTNMIEILHSGLSMDNEYEAFIVKHELDTTFIPCKPWDDNYNISVWFLQLRGVDDDLIVKHSIDNFNKHSELESMRLWLNLSRKNFKEKSLDLLKVKGLEDILNKIENPCLTHLYRSIMTGHFEESIEIINECEKLNLFDNYICNLPYKIAWKKIGNLDSEIDNCLDRANHKNKIDKYLFADIKGSSNLLNIPEGNGINFPINLENDEDQEDFEIESILSGDLNFIDDDDNEESNRLNFDEEDLNSNINNYPSGRGGHSMALDQERLIIYLFGGWNGSDDLDDFWLYDIKKEKWKLISSNTSKDNGPSKRSCHKMVYDSTFNRLLLYGKYSLNNAVANLNCTMFDYSNNSDCNVYEYNINKNEWHKHMPNKELKNGIIHLSTGPGQVYDHQLVMDSKNQILFLFGGNKVPDTNDSVNGRYLGLWRLNLNGMYWENLSNNNLQDPYGIKLKSRCGHVMLLGPSDDELIIYGGLKGPKKLNTNFSLFDMMTYNMKNKTIKEIFHDYSKENGPCVNFSSCSFYEKSSRELFTFGGSVLNGKSDVLSNNFMVYNFNAEKWTKTELDDSSTNYDELLIYNNFYFDLYGVDSIETNLKGLNINCDKMNMLFNVDTTNEPVPRYAHSMVYSSMLKKGFVFGGNPNIKNNSSKTERLKDFWSFELIKPNSNDIKNKILLNIYATYYAELCSKEMFEKSLDLMNNKIISLIDSKNNENISVENLRKKLFFKCEISHEDNMIIRHNLFERISSYVVKSNRSNEILLNR